MASQQDRILYSQQTVEASVARYEEQSGKRLIRIDAGKCEEWAAHLAAKRGKYDSDGAFWKWASQEEAALIRNERVMSMLDFRYWAMRYGSIQQDGGGVCKFDHPWESQEILLRLIAKLEARLIEAALRGEPVDGILICLHKARQLGATAVGRLLMVHGLIYQKNRRGMSASVDDDKIQELYDRDKLIYDNLPWYLRPELKYDEKRQHIHFDVMDSRMLYQVSSQKSGLGVGRQFDRAHLTELSTWLNASAVELDFFPTLPQSLSTLAVLESTAYGRGNWWHDFTERVRKGHSARWTYAFIPWYAEASKYRRQPPVGWVPSDVSILHAKKIHDTSAAYLEGKQLMLPRENLYWWESTRAEYQRGNNLTFFLTNYCATPEESFQHSGTSAFPAELLEDMRLHARPGVPYELRTAR
jgi:hypothetical protein